MGSSDAQAQRASIIGTIKLAQRLAAPQADEAQAGTGTGTPPHHIVCRSSTTCHVNNESEDCENKNRKQAPLHVTLLLLSEKVDNERVSRRLAMGLCLYKQPFHVWQYAGRLKQATSSGLLPHTMSL